MPDITDPRALRYLGDLRRASEYFRADKAVVDDLLVQWNDANMKALFPNDASAVVDGRASEGVTQVTSAEVNTLVNLLTAFQVRMNQAGTSAVVSKHCVRSFEVR
jgi:hypothetical protein